MGARVFLLADSRPPERGETAVVSTSLGATNTALQSMLAEETCATCLSSARSGVVARIAEERVALRVVEQLHASAGNRRFALSANRSK